MDLKIMLFLVTPFLVCNAVSALLTVARKAIRAHRAASSGTAVTPELG